MPNSATCCPISCGRQRVAQARERRCVITCDGSLAIRARKPLDRSRGRKNACRAVRISKEQLIVDRFEYPGGMTGPAGRSSAQLPASSSICLQHGLKSRCARSIPRPCGGNRARGSSPRRFSRSLPSVVVPRPIWRCGKPSDSPWFDIHMSRLYLLRPRCCNICRTGERVRRTGVGR